MLSALREPAHGDERRAVDISEAFPLVLTAEKDVI